MELKDLKINKKTGQYIIEHPIRPAALVTLPDAKYLMPYWIKVDKDFSLDMVEERRPKVKRLTDDIEHNKILGSFKSSSSDNIYNVKNTGGVITCTCPGYSFRRKCKHVAQIQIELVKITPLNKKRNVRRRYSKIKKIHVNES